MGSLVFWDWGFKDRRQCLDVFLTVTNDLLVEIFDLKSMFNRVCILSVHRIKYINILKPMPTINTTERFNFSPIKKSARHEKTPLYRVEKIFDKLITRKTDKILYKII